jgi:hypothetical protein
VPRDRVRALALTIETPGETREHLHDTIRAGVQFTVRALRSNRSSQPALSPIEGFNRFAPFKTLRSPHLVLRINVSWKRVKFRVRLSAN